MQLTALFVLWAVVTTIVLVLAFYRLTLGMHEHTDLHIDQVEAAQAAAQMAMDRKISKIELYGKTLTVLSLVLIAWIATAWVYEQFIA
jgi:uncharacterized membrane protein YjfL (UPF0719 family)